jgi:hypothetical protein
LPSLDDCMLLASMLVLRIPPTPRFIEIPRERGGGKAPFTEEQLDAMRGGMTAEEYRWYLIKKFGE